ncbi:MAG: hypothetical protein HPY82_11325 [Gammaproteobacteria bacterium]|nr:hypothetical protein [Gammaproteobacteria bacterium]
MKIGGSQFQSQISSTPYAREWQRQDVQQAQREQEKVREREIRGETIDADVQISDGVRRSAQQRQVVAASGSASTQRGPQYYPLPDRGSLSASQQRALQTYSTNQGLSRTIDVRSEFLGSVDVFA